MSALPPVYLEFKGDTKHLHSSIVSASNELKRFSNTADSTAKSVSRMSSGQNIAAKAFAAFSVVKVVQGMKSLVDASSNLSESISKSNVVFGKNAAEVEAWSKNSAQAFGLSQQAAIEAAGTYGNLFQSFGITRDKATEMSKSLVGLAADLASFNNTSVDEALLALRSGLSGETEPLKRFGVALNEDRLKLQALDMGLIKNTKGTLPIAIKAQAAYALLMKDTSLAQGDFARTSGGMANQMRIASAQIENAKAALGDTLLPIVIELVKTFNEKLIPAIQRVTDAFKLKGATEGFKTVAAELKNFVSGLDGIGRKIYLAILLMMNIKLVSIPVMALRAQWIAVAAAEGAAASASVIAAGVMRAALVSTGVGALVVGLGLVVTYLMDINAQAKQTSTSMDYIGTTEQLGRFRGLANGAEDVSLAVWNIANQAYQANLNLTRMADAADNAGILDVKRKTKWDKGVAPAKPTTSPTTHATTSSAGKSGAKKKTAKEKAAEIVAASKAITDAYKFEGMTATQQAVAQNKAAVVSATANVKAAQALEKSTRGTNAHKAAVNALKVATAAQTKANQELTKSIKENADAQKVATAEAKAAAAAQNMTNLSAKLTLDLAIETDPSKELELLKSYRDQARTVYLAAVAQEVATRNTSAHQAAQDALNSATTDYASAIDSVANAQAALSDATANAAKNTSNLANQLSRTNAELARMSSLSANNSWLAAQTRSAGPQRENFGGFVEVPVMIDGQVVFRTTQKYSLLNNRRNVANGLKTSGSLL